MSRFRARHLVEKSAVQEIACHRVHDGKEQYLIRWRHATPQDAVISWHSLEDLGSIVDMLQSYVNNFADSFKNNETLRVPGVTKSLKRKSPHDESASSRASSIDTTSSTESATSSTNIWNGILQRKSGDITPFPMVAERIARIDATTLPTQQMLTAARRRGPKSIEAARKYIFEQFQFRLAILPGPPVTVYNECDKETPSLAFSWIQDYVYGAGVSRVDADAVMMGCSKCRPDMGGNKGCEYTRVCDCLEYATPDPARLKDDEKMRYIAWEEGQISPEGLPKRFPYRVVDKMYVLDNFYLESRNVIYECNPKCRCGPNCKNRMVQKGRRVPLEIFKTAKRGFGLRCPINLKRGQFIDKYLGEMITNKEADAREAASSGPGKASYLFTLDKFANDDDSNAPSKNDCYIADGEHMGGPTRFINHSCDPNCRLFTVSYNRHDVYIYDLAFFALREIPAGEELTFDYMDPEEGEAGQASLDDLDEADELVDCLCGAKKCRGRLWV